MLRSEVDGVDRIFVVGDGRAWSHSGTDEVSLDGLPAYYALEVIYCVFAKGVYGDLKSCHLLNTLCVVHLSNGEFDHLVVSRDVVLREELLHDEGLLEPETRRIDFTL